RAAHRRRTNRFDGAERSLKAPIHLAAIAVPAWGDQGTTKQSTYLSSFTLACRLLTTVDDEPGAPTTGSPWPVAVGRRAVRSRAALQPTSADRLLTSLAPSLVFRLRKPQASVRRRLPAWPRKGTARRAAL